MEKIRWGIVGPGIIARKFAEAVKNVEGATLAAVASRDAERGKAFAQRFDVPTVFCGYDEMAKSDAVDAVYIATPHNFHAPCAELFMNAGKHVLCEKPLCVNAAQARRMKECARGNGVFLMEAMWSRFLPAIIEAQKLVKDGAIGQVLGVEADFCYHTDADPSHRVLLDALAGGGLLDVGVYCLHFVSLFLGNSPEKISAMAKLKDGIDLHTNVLMQYDGGAIAKVSAAVGLRKPADAYVYGTAGYIKFPRFYSTNEFTVVYESGEETVRRPCIGKGFEEQIIEACRCIREGKGESDVLPIDESIVMMEQMDEIRRQIGLKYPDEVEK